MTVRFSADQFEALRRELADFLDPSLEEFASEIRIGDAAQVWVIDEELLRSERYPTLARVARPLEVYHHQLTLRNTVIGYARSVVRGGQASLSETGDSSLAELIEERLVRAGQVPIFETRLLEVPQLQTEALWLDFADAKKSSVAVLRCPEGSPLKGGALWSDRQFCVRLKSATSIVGIVPAAIESSGVESDLFSVGMDARWWLADMGEFSKSFTEAYSFIYWLSSQRRDRARAMFEQYPWRGGWSRLDFYQRICAAVPSEHKPAIRRIAYSSPGTLLLALDRATAEALSQTLQHLLRHSDVVKSVVDQITGEMKRRKLRRDAETTNQLPPSDVAFVADAAAQLAGLLRVDLHWLNELSKDPLVSLKMLITHYLRLSPLIALLRERKINLPEA